MEDIDSAISTLQELIRCAVPDKVRNLKRKFEDLAGAAAKESLNLEGMPSIYQLNEETKALDGKVVKLYSRGKFSEGIALDVFEDTRGVILSAPKLVGETTAIGNMEKILEMLNGDVGKIGVYGMGGIGKTTIMKHINNRIVKEQRDKFNCVIWVTVSKESSIFKLQDDIACKLNVNLLKYKDATTRAGILCEAFQKMGRYILILDDLWEGYPLEDVGIPDPDDPTFSNGCKLVLTTRSLDVCRSMKCEAMKMNLLTKEEAWSSFLDHVGRDVLCVKDLEPIIRDVALECACLPLAIATIATSMRGEKEACEWRVALAKLRAFSKELGDKGKKVIEQLKFSYDRLENKRLQKCLLLCALYPEDEQIERGQLVELLALEGIIEEKESKQDEIDEGHAMLNNLINQCLLEGEITSKVNSWVKMHDLVRDMALQIDSHYLAASGTELRKLSYIKWTEDRLKIHISNCYSLNVSPMCPRLTTFILQDYYLKSIPYSFFQHFKALKVLSLSSCRNLEELPNSISELVNLVGLLLRNCYNLKYLPPLQKLKDLQTLDMSDSSKWHMLLVLNTGNKTINVPEGLEELNNLRYLNLMLCRVKVFPLGIIPKLSNLRHLVCCPFTKISVSELMSLKHLEMFKGTFHDIDDLMSYVKHREQNKSQLTSYTFLIALTSWFPNFGINAYGDNYFDKVVKLIYGNLGKSSAEHDLYLIPKDVQMLEIQRVHDLTNLCGLASLNYAADLQTCEIKNCDGVKELVSNSSSSSFVLSSLQRLEVSNMENLKVLIGRKKGLCNVFPCLQVLKIKDCPKMKAILNIRLLSNLNNLITLEVHYCEVLKEIIEESLDDDRDVNEATTDITLPKLRSLYLCDLPNVKSICPATRRLICKSLKKIYIQDCPKLEQSFYAPLDDSGEPSLSASLERIDLKLYKQQKLNIDESFWEELFPWNY